MPDIPKNALITQYYCHHEHWLPLQVCNVSSIYRDVIWLAAGSNTVKHTRLTARPIARPAKSLTTTNLDVWSCVTPLHLLKNLPLLFQFFSNPLIESSRSRLLCWVGSSEGVTNYCVQLVNLLEENATCIQYVVWKENSFDGIHFSILPTFDMTVLPITTKILMILVQTLLAS